MAQYLNVLYGSGYNYIPHTTHILSHTAILTLSTKHSTTINYTTILKRFSEVKYSRIYQYDHDITFNSLLHKDLERYFSINTKYNELHPFIYSYIAYVYMHVVSFLYCMFISVFCIYSEY